jgi:hypothetical protein
MDFDLDHRSDGAGGIMDYWPRGSRICAHELLAKAFGQRLVLSLLLRSKSPSLLCQGFQGVASFKAQYLKRIHGADTRAGQHAECNAPKVPARQLVSIRGRSLREILG